MSRAWHTIGYVGSTGSRNIRYRGGVGRYKVGRWVGAGISAGEAGTGGRYGWGRTQAGTKKFACRTQYHRFVWQVCVARTGTGRHGGVVAQYGGNGSKIVCGWGQAGNAVKVQV